MDCVTHIIIEFSITVRIVYLDIIHVIDKEKTLPSALPLNIGEKSRHFIASRLQNCPIQRSININGNATTAMAIK